MKPDYPAGRWAYSGKHLRSSMSRIYHGRVRMYEREMIRREIEEMEECYEEGVKLIGRCLRCCEPIYNEPGCPNNPSRACEVRIGGYWGSTAFDGSDITGQFLWGLLCDNCVETLMATHTVTEPRRGPDWSNR